MKGIRTLLLTAVILCLISPEAEAQRRANPAYEPPDPEPLSAVQAAAWDTVGPGLHGSIGSDDVRYARNTVPQTRNTTISWTSGWRGERIGIQLVLWASQDIEQVRFETVPQFEEIGRPPAEGGPTLDGACLTPRFVRYTLGDGGLYPDILDDAPLLDIPARSVRPVWVQIDIPADAEPAFYQMNMIVRSEGGVAIPFTFKVEVLDWVLPDPVDWEFHLDLWQNPYALARYHHVELWSPEHFALLEPHLRLLLDAGQKVLTTTILHQPWGTQTYDPYDSMVEWIRGADGTWRYDYSIFDRYVEFATGIGFNGPINCYSTVPWTNRIYFADEATGDRKSVDIPAGSDIYREMWTPFLRDFSRHLIRKGWLDRVTLAMDERPPEQMNPAIDLIRQEAPGLRIALAGGNHPELNERIDDWCVYVTPPLASDIIEERNRRIASGEDHLQTTYYVCCNPERPNTFTHSPPAESAWIGIHAAARGYTGFLRWAYDSWVADPLFDTRHVTWAAGDCFLVYPGARSSIRFERLRQGIVAYEQIRILRERLGASTDSEILRWMRQLEEALSMATWDAAQERESSYFVNIVLNSITDLSRAGQSIR
ncbi:DUF4091 domain-containing protein [Gemmatimonadota bacterium]